jgi:hypothetical protein
VTINHDAGSGTVFELTMAWSTTSFATPCGLYRTLNVMLPIGIELSLKVPVRPLEVRIGNSSPLKGVNPLIRLSWSVPLFS